MAIESGRELKARLAKPAAEEAPLARYVTRHLSYPFTLVFLRTRLTPNQVTGISTLVFLLGAAAQVDQCHRWVSLFGALLLWIGLILDTVDGEVARYRRLFTVKGAYIDMVGHRVINACLFMATGIGLWRRDHSALPLLLSMGAMFGEFGYSFMLYARWRALLDFPQLMLDEVRRVTEAPKGEQKGIKAGFAAGDRPSRIRWLATFYDVWFGKDYVGAILLTTTALSIADRLIYLLWIYGLFLPLRFALLFVRRFTEPFVPENPGTGSSR